MTLPKGHTLHKKTTVGMQQLQDRQKRHSNLNLITKVENITTKLYVLMHVNEFMAA